MKNLDVDTPFPNVTKTLVKALERSFPKRDFDTSNTLRDIDYYSGQRSVVNFLKNQLEIQSENIMKD